MAAYAWTPSALTWLHVNHLINGLHKQISWKTVNMPGDNLYFTLAILAIKVKVAIAIVAIATIAS